MATFAHNTHTNHYTMLKPLMFMAFAALTAASAQAEHQNPFLQPSYSTPYEIPPFEQIEYADYLPAMQEGIRQQKAEIQAIIDNPATPTFDNTILALDKSGRLATKVMRVFGALNESMSSPEMADIAAQAMPMYTQLDDEMSMNDALFQRVKYVHDHAKELGLDKAQTMLTDKYYKEFTNNGALLQAEQKEQLKALNAQLTDLYLQFNKNLLAATNQWQLVVDDASRLSGLPESSVAVAAEEAAKRGLEGKWVFTLHAPSRLPVLQYADDRQLRRDMYEGYTSLASQEPYDNRPVIDKIVHARAKKAALLGFPNYAEYQTSKVMSKNVAAAEDLLMQVWSHCTKRAHEEVEEMQRLADRQGAGITIAPYDYYYYAEKVRKDKYDLDEATVRQYFELDNVRRGIFTMAEKLYGISFTEMPDAPKYHPEVKVYDVRDANTGEHVAVFMSDYFPRASKRQGAWMDEFLGSYVDEDGTVGRPIIYNVGNFTKPTASTPSLLTIDEVQTMFHEFGHGLHGMLSRAKYRGQSGTNTDRDFVEMPSQIHEHWALSPEMLKIYARHYKTGEVIPDSLVQKITAASHHNQGFDITERIAASLLDLEYGKLNPTDSDYVDTEAFERQISAKLGKPSEIEYRYRSPYFKHIFGSDEYSCGYYTYTWAEVLDTDGFELFEERGIFDPATAAAFKHGVLEMGGSADPMDLFVGFRGHKPSVDALLRAHGFIPAKTSAERTDVRENNGK